MAMSKGGTGTEGGELVLVGVKTTKVLELAEGVREVVEKVVADILLLLLLLLFEE